MEGEFEAIERSARKSLIRFCRGLLGDAHKAEDVAQETLVRFLTARPTRDRARAWLFTTARNLCVDEQRRHDAGRSGGLPSSFELAEETSRALSRIVRVERSFLVAKALEAIDPKFREVLLLRYGEGMSRAEVGDVLGLDLDQVRTRLAEGKRRLEVQLDRLKLSRPAER